MLRKGSLVASSTHERILSIRCDKRKLSAYQNTQNTMFCGLVFEACWDLKDALNLAKNRSKKLISLASVARYFNLELIRSFIRRWFFNFVTLVLTSKSEFIDTLVHLWYLIVNDGGLWLGIYTVPGVWILK